MICKHPSCDHEPGDQFKSTLYCGIHQAALPDKQVTKQSLTVQPDPAFRDNFNQAMGQAIGRMTKVEIGQMANWYGGDSDDMDAREQAQFVWATMNELFEDDPESAARELEEWSGLRATKERVGDVYQERHAVFENAVSAYGMVLSDFPNEFINTALEDDDADPSVLRGLIDYAEEEHDGNRADAWRDIRETLTPFEAINWLSA